MENNGSLEAGKSSLRSIVTSPNQTRIDREMRYILVVREDAAEADCIVCFDYLPLYDIFYYKIP